MVQRFDKESNWNVVLQQFCFGSRSWSAGPNRTIFFDFLEKSDLAMILHLLAVGAHEGERRPKEKFQLLHV